MGNHLVEVKVWGKYACFTRPENKVERLSYPIITPSAAVGVLESIYWKPEFRWQITEVGVLPHPDRNGILEWENYMPITLNEVASPGETRSTEQCIDYEYFNRKSNRWEIRSNRVQRTCLVLRWPCYLIRAQAHIFTDATNLMAIKRQFDDRVKSGKCYQQPYLGLREFTAYFAEMNEIDRSCFDHPEAHEAQPFISRDNLGMIFHSSVVPPGCKRVKYRFISLKIEKNKFTVALPEVKK